MNRAIAFAALCLFAVPCLGRDSYQSVECKKFTRAEGVEVSPEFPDFLYAALRAELQKAKLFKEILSEGEVVDSASEAQSVVVEGSLVHFKKGSVIKESLIGFGSGRRSLKASFTAHRRSNREKLLDRDLQVKTSSRMNEKLLARSLAKKIVKEMKEGLKLK